MWSLQASSRQRQVPVARVFRWALADGRVAEIGVVACAEHMREVFEALSHVQGINGDPRAGQDAGVLGGLDSQVNPHAQEAEHPKD